MCRTTCNILHLTIVTLLLLPMTALAMPAITCHCFTDRSYDAAHPAAADPYLLATTQNSFFAIVFNTDKKSIVIQKQQGISSDDLWIAYWVGSKDGVSPDALLQSKLRHEAWKDVLAALRLTAKNLGAHFTTALNAKMPPAYLAATAVDEIFLRYQLLPPAELAALRKTGASNQELIIATVIAAKTKQPARQVYHEVKSGIKTWGSLLLWAGVDTKNMQQEIAMILKLRSQ